MAKKTILILTPGNELHSTVAAGHDRVSYADRSVGPDGKVTIPPPRVSHRLKESHSVSRVSIDRDADGNLYLTLEE